MTLPSRINPPFLAALTLSLLLATLAGAVVEENPIAPLDQSLEFAKQVTAAKEIGELGLNTENYVIPQLVEKLAAACESNPALGEKAVRRAVQLYISAQQNGAFHNRNEEDNGNNFASLLLERIGGRAPGYGTLRMAWRLFHHDISGQFAHTSWEQLHGWDKALSAAFEKGGGRTNRAAGLRAMLEPLRDIIGGDPPGLMLIGLCGFATRLDPWEQIMVEQASDNLVREGGDLARLAKLLSSALRLSRMKLLHGPPSRPDAKWLAENGAWLTELRTLANDPAIPVAERFALASHLVRDLSPLRDAEIILKGVEAGAETMSWDQPTNGYAWEPLLIAFNTLPDTPAWRATAEHFHKAWVQRCRFEHDPPGTPHRFSPWTVCSYHSLETVARLGNAESFKALAALHRLNTPQVFVLMVRHGLHDAAAEWLRGKSNQQPAVKIPGIGFRDPDAIAVNKFCTTLHNPALELLARIHVANNPSGDDGLPRPGSKTPRWDARLSALVPAFRSTTFASESARLACLNLLCDGPATGLLLREEVTKACADATTILGRVNGTSQIYERLRLPSALACNGAAAGDLAPLESIMAGLRSSVRRPSDYPYSYAATFIVGEINEAATLLAPESDATGITRWRNGMDLALELLEGETSDELVSQSLVTQLALHALAQSNSSLEQWRARLPKKKIELLQQTLKDYHKDLVGSIAAMCRRGTDGLRSPEERIRIITAMLADPWMRGVTGGFYTLLHSLVRKGVVTPEELLGAAKEISAADRDNGRRIRELASLAWEAGQKDIAKQLLDDAAANTKVKGLEERYKLGGAEVK